MILSLQRALRTAAVCTLAAVPVSPLRADTDATYAAIRAARPDGRTLPVQQLTLERDAFRFQLESGTLHLLAAVDGRTFGAVFLGHGSFRLSPASPHERRQLALSSGAGEGFEVLNDRFEDLLLLFTDDTLADLERHAAIQTGAPDPRAAAALDDWLKRQRQEIRTNFQLRLLPDLLAPPNPSAGIFLALFDGKEMPPAVAAVDPAGAEELFGASRGGGEDTLFWVINSTKGGIWYLSDRTQEVSTGRPTPALQRADALDYRIETEVERDTDLAGRATLRFRTLEDGLRVLPVRLVQNLRLHEAAYAIEADAAAEPAWQPLAWIQEDEKEDGDAAVVFPQPLPRGAVVRLRLAYKGGKILQSVGGKSFLVTARSSWYPNLGVFSDPAEFELVYRIPAHLDIVSVGRKVEERTEGKQKISLWRTAGPIQVAGFNYGKFDRHERKDEESGFEIEVFTGTDRPDLGPEVGLVSAARLADSAAVDGVNAARVFTAYFGPLPQTRVAITQQAQWSFGQSWPSLIFLPYVSFLDGTQRQALGLGGASDFVNQVGFHELAHQWWGHLVGAATDRDQWLEEGFSEFSAALAVQHTQGWPAYNDFWKDARKHILGKYPGNVISHDRAGPITQGWRLGTARTPSAPNAMLYSKGGYVLHMLRTLLWDSKAPTPDAQFIALMTDFTRTYGGKTATTADFQKVVERHMTPALNAVGDGSMSWFFDQWVYGTDIPRYRADLKIDKLGGDEYRIHGEVSQEGVATDFRALVPLSLEFGKNEDVRIGLMRIIGNSVMPIDVKLKLPKAPKRALVNAHGEVLARD